MLRLCLLLTSSLFVIQPFVPALGQTGEPQEHQLTLEEVSAAASIYFRDTAEFPMLQHTVLTVTDSKGHIRKQHQGSFDYLLEGFPLKPGAVLGTYFPRDVNIMSAIRQAWDGTLRSAIASNAYAMFPLYLLVAGQLRPTMRVVSKENDGIITAHWDASQACPAFTFSERRLYLPGLVCGDSEVELRPDLSLQRFVFDEGGLPASTKVSPFGKTILQSFRVEIDFQEVMVSPDPQPYVVPLRVTSTLVTAKGTVNIVSDYTPNGPPKLKISFPRIPLRSTPG